MQKMLLSCSRAGQDKKGKYEKTKKIRSSLELHMLLWQPDVTSSESKSPSVANYNHPKKLAHARLKHTKNEGLTLQRRERCQPTAPHNSVKEIHCGARRWRRALRSLAVAVTEDATAASPAHYFPVEATTRNCVNFIGLGETHQRSLDFPSQASRWRHWRVPSGRWAWPVPVPVARVRACFPPLWDVCVRRRFR